MPPRHENNECDCPVHEDVKRLKRTVYGDDDHLGLVSAHHKISWKLNLIIFISAAIGTGFLAALGQGLLRFVTPHAAPAQQNVTQSVITSDDTATKPGTYTTAQLAAKLQLSTREVQDRAANGEIPGAWKDGKAWRFDQPSIDAWLAAQAATAVTAANAADADQN